MNELTTTIDVVITDDHPIVANGLKNVLARMPQIQVTGVFNSAPELLKNIASLQPDVLILDRQLQESDCLETVSTLLKSVPSLQILIFSSTDTTYQVKKLLEAGCSGYLLKDADDEMLVKAIETVSNGRRFLSPSLETALLEDMFKEKSNARKKAILTKREKEVLDLIVKEYTNQEMAETLFLSLSAIEFRRNSMMQKLGVKNTAGLVRVAVQSGLV